MSLPSTEHFQYESPVDSYIRDLNVAARALRRELMESHPSGTLTFTVTFPMRMDLEWNKLAVPKISLSFYHYESFNTTVTVEGLEWEEVKGEILRRLGRDKSLKRLANLSGEE